MHASDIVCICVISSSPFASFAARDVCLFSLIYWKCFGAFSFIYTIMLVWIVHLLRFTQCWSSWRWISLCIYAKSHFGQTTQNDVIYVCSIRTMERHGCSYYVVIFSKVLTRQMKHNMFVKPQRTSAFNITCLWRRQKEMSAVKVLAAVCSCSWGYSTGAMCPPGDIFEYSFKTTTFPTHSRCK